MVFVFDRYIEGRKMAEGARINHASTLVDAVMLLHRPGEQPQPQEGGVDGKTRT